jgi:hypothetical protein
VQERVLVGENPRRAVRRDALKPDLSTKQIRPLRAFARAADARLSIRFCAPLMRRKSGASRGAVRHGCREMRDIARVGSRSADSSASTSRDRLRAPISGTMYLPCAATHAIAAYAGVACIAIADARSRSIQVAAEVLPLKPCTEITVIVSRKEGLRCPPKRPARARHKP